MSIRTALEADFDLIVALWATGAGPTRLSSGRADVARLHERDPDALLIAEVDGAVAGTLVVGWDGWRCHLYRMAVDPAFRRQGIAKALVEASRRRAREVGARRIDAMVADENTGAINFWQACGFKLDTDDHRWSVLL